MTNALIMGINGFVGSHLAEFLLRQGYSVFGTLRKNSKTEKIEHIKDKIKLVEADINVADSVYNAIKQIKPDEIYCLASFSNPKKSWSEPREAIVSNVIGALNIFEAVRKLDMDPLIQVAGSCDEYGLVYEDELPVNENNPLRPLSPYGVGKVAQDMLSFQYTKSYGLKIIVTRGFNSTGPRRDDNYVFSNFSKQIVRIQKGLQKPVMLVGDLKAKRDFTDIRDVVRAYHLSLQKGVPGERYNICSGKTYSIKNGLDILLSMTNVKIEIKKDTKRIRPSDVSIMAGTYDKFYKQTGWKPEIPFEKTLKDLMDYWKEKIK